MGHDERVRLLRLNKNLLKLCDTNSVNNAIKRSRNNDRVVIMPGRYTEPKSRDAATNDPQVQPEPAPEGRQRRRHAELHLPGHLSQRPEPDLPPGPQGGPDKQLPTPRSDRRGVPDEGPCVRCNMQIDGSGVKPEDVILDAGGLVQRQGEGPQPPSRARTPSTWSSAPTASDGFVGRNMLFKGALRARLLHRGDRRHPPGKRQVLLERRLRAPGLHLRSPAGPELRRLRLGRLGRLPRRRARDRRADDEVVLARRAAPEQPPSRSATCAGRRSATRARWATPCASPATTSTATPRASPATRCRRPATPASPPTARRSTTTTSTPTTSTSTSRTRR